MRFFQLIKRNLTGNCHTEFPFYIYIAHFIILGAKFMHKKISSCAQIVYLCRRFEQETGKLNKLLNTVI